MMGTEGSRARLAASITSMSATCDDADWNSERPVATTLAMWLFLLRSAMEMASSSLPSRNAPATCGKKTRDCLRAALYISTRSIMTPRDHAERRNRIPTTAFAIILILLHIVLRSHWPCRTIRFIAATDRFASMSFAPFYFVQDFISREQRFAVPANSLIDGLNFLAGSTPTKWSLIPQAAALRYPPIVNVTVIGVTTSTGSPFTCVG